MIYEIRDTSYELRGYDLRDYELRAPSDDSRVWHLDCRMFYSAPYLDNIQLNRQISWNQHRRKILRHRRNIVQSSAAAVVIYKSVYGARSLHNFSNLTDKFNSTVIIKMLKTVFASLVMVSLQKGDNKAKLLYLFVGTDR
jgi:hypothetical protein